MNRDIFLLESLVIVLVLAFNKAPLLTVTVRPKLKVQFSVLTVPVCKNRAQREFDPLFFSNSISFLGNLLPIASIMMLANCCLCYFLYSIVILISAPLVLTLSPPYFSVQIKLKTCKNINSLQQHLKGFIRSWLLAVNRCLRCLTPPVTKPHIQESSSCNIKYRNGQKQL